MSTIDPGKNPLPENDAVAPPVIMMVESPLLPVDVELPPIEMDTVPLDKVTMRPTMDIVDTDDVPSEKVI
jgi:hypothetical protein